MRVTNQNVGREKTGIKCSHQQLEEFRIGREQFEKKTAETEGFHETDDGDESSIGIGAPRQFLEQKRAKSAKNLPRPWSNVKGSGTLRQSVEGTFGPIWIGENLEIDWEGGWFRFDQAIKNFAHLRART